MYEKRIKIFVILSAVLLLVCLLRLIQMQLRYDSALQDEIAELKQQRGLSRQLKTVRGKILDRKGKVLATDEPQFQLYINYKLNCFMDERVQRGKLLRIAGKPNAEPIASDVQEEQKTKLEDLQQIIDKCVYFGLEREYIENRIKEINDKMWDLRTFVAWVRNDPEPDILEKYEHKVNSVPLSEAILSFEGKFPDEEERLLLISKVDDIVDMGKDWPLLELKTDDDIFTAQLEFMNVDGVQILAKGHRLYPYDSVAAQTIGWVGLEHDRKLFANDRLLSYLEGEVSGRRPGVEYVCEAILRGRRGEEVYDIDRELQSRTKTRFGKDVSLTLDIELQERIENYLAGYEHDLNCGPGMAVVVIDVATGDILSLVSMPVFDLNRTRYDYDSLVHSPTKPLINRAICEQYPPGSVIKPLILIAGLESGKISPDEIISCSAQKAPKGWPSCWLYNRYSWRCHDDDWANIARNAVRGSCNIYFSRLANRVDPLVLQQWLFKFGDGHKILFSPVAVRESELNRNLRQAQGQISNVRPKSTISDFEQVPPLEKSERRFFGIGQGNLRVSPLQVANAMAVIARGGLYKPPRLFMENDDSKFASVALNISPETLDVVRDGMSAVVNEPGGTAYKEFAHSGFAEQDVKVYGKTGSTEKPDNAWFAGFAEDSEGRSIAIAVVVEGGQHGSSDAAPLARDIIQLCIEAEYIGQPGFEMDEEADFEY